MANTTFAGAIAEQEYQWEYTCEFCGKRVEKTGKLTASHGFGRNVNTRWSVNRAWSQEAIAQAERKLAEKKAQTESLSQSGQWAPVGDDGKCPYCGKYQHWSRAAREAFESGKAPDEQVDGQRPARRSIGDLPGYYLYVGMSAMLLMGLLMTLATKLFPAGQLSSLAVLLVLLACVVIGIGIPVLAMKLIRRRTQGKDAELRKSLEGIQQTMPRFLSWGFHQSYVKGVNTR